jgi:hypothetical protein
MHTRAVRTFLAVALLAGTSLSQTALSPFAVSMSASSRNNIHTWAQPISQAGVRWTRGWPPTVVITSARGVYDWTGVDRYMQVSEENNLNMVAILNNVPGWISSELEFPVADLDGWAEVVTDMVNHCKDKVKYWEVWNEPPNFCHTALCTPENYAATVVASYDAAKAADPDCKIGLAAKSNFTSWLEKAIVAGAADHFDFITLHPYEILGTAIANGSEAHFMGIVPAVRKLLRQHNLSWETVPVLFTELGIPLNDTVGGWPVTEAVQAHFLVKAYTMGIAQGVDGLFWFEVRDGDSGPMGLIDGSDVPRLSYHALKSMIDNLGQNPEYLGWVLLNDRHYGFAFQGPSGTVLVTWAKMGTSDMVDFGQSVEILDPLTGSSAAASTWNLTESPVMIVGLPATLITEAEQNKSSPFPWGGDYSGAQSATITVGDPNDEQGLHQLYPDLKSGYVESPYGPARYCEASPDQVFLIDPNFLLYTTVPITVTAVVRRNENNDNAGFNLWYESTTWNNSSGTNFKSTGSWYTVPGNDQWYTKTWTIDDAQFTGMWGYNLWFQSDSRQYSKYYLQSVTVTKDGAAERSPQTVRRYEIGAWPLLSTLRLEGESLCFAVVHSGPYLVSLVDSRGRQIEAVAGTGPEQRSLDVSGLSAGIYMLHALAGMADQTAAIVVW